MQPHVRIFGSFSEGCVTTFVQRTLIYAFLTICAEDLLLLHPLIAMLSTETVAFVSFRLLRRQRVCFWMHSDVHFCFSSLLFSPSSASPSFVVACRGLSFARFCFSLCRLPFSRLLCLPVTVVGFLFVVPSSASHSFASASRRLHWPATR